MVCRFDFPTVRTIEILGCEDFTGFHIYCRTLIKMDFYFGNILRLRNYKSKLALCPDKVSNYHLASYFSLS
ncbi:hypothetical protein HZS_4603 [Henneguya salminicola]|nr:hypothetical protein HZS_4603 [Henneguya salminicola]